MCVCFNVRFPSILRVLVSVMQADAGCWRVLYFSYLADQCMRDACGCGRISARQALRHPFFRDIRDVEKVPRSPMSGEGAPQKEERTTLPPAVKHEEQKKEADKAQDGKRTVCMRGDGRDGKRDVRYCVDG
mmetsp:Transcript_18148/g.45300  ORF Transcript_18148/g.45300 Transcript_18148/m.45300 type:complete len:131 (-) Transcript_18148:1099-1491(-)